ncbi:MAG: response regulator transcription factor [Pseudomonadota bacterium]
MSIASPVTGSNSIEGSAVLVVEDHRDIAEMVVDHLAEKNVDVDYAADGNQAWRLLCANQYDAVVLDVMLPGIDGLEVCQRLRRERNSDIAVLMLTARDALDEKIAGFDSGADDYLVKPFDLEELAARLGALLRRRHGKLESAILSVGDLVLDLKTRQVERGGRTLAVTPIGFKILHLLMRESPRVVERSAIERTVWGDIPPDSDALRSHLYTLRKAVDKPFSQALIKTVHGAGFRLSEGV